MHTINVIQWCKLNTQRIMLHCYIASLLHCNLPPTMTWYNMTNQQHQQSDDHRSTAAASRCSDESCVAPPSLHPPSLSDCYADGSFTDDGYSHAEDTSETAARVQPPLQRETAAATVRQKLVLLGTTMATSGECYLIYLLQAHAFETRKASCRCTSQNADCVNS
jgi:hypothetical protein